MKELGGDHMDVLEIDLQRGPEHDMMSDELYAALLRGVGFPFRCGGGWTELPDQECAPTLSTTWRWSTTGEVTGKRRSGRTT